MSMFDKVKANVDQARAEADRIKRFREEAYEARAKLIADLWSVISEDLARFEVPPKDLRASFNGISPARPIAERPDKWDHLRDLIEIKTRELEYSMKITVHDTTLSLFTLTRDMGRENIAVGVTADKLVEVLASELSKLVLKRYIRIKEGSDES